VGFHLENKNHLPVTPNFGEREREKTLPGNFHNEDPERDIQTPRGGELADPDETRENCTFYSTTAIPRTSPSCHGD
jgi:hypothetical protein